MKIFLDVGLCVKVDLCNEKVGFKICEYILCCVLYMFVCGDKEIVEGKIVVCICKGVDLGIFKVEEFVEILKN